MRPVFSCSPRLGVLLAVTCGLLSGQSETNGGTVTIEVTDPGGTGVAHAEVRFSPPPEEGRRKLETDVKGKLTLKVKPGSYTLVVACPGFKTSSTLVTVRDAEEIQRVSVRLQIGEAGSAMVETAPLNSPPNKCAISEPASLVAQKETFVPASDVSFKISTGQTTWQAGQSITVLYTVKNISNAPLFVPREWEATCPANPHLWAWFEDSSGKHFVPGYGGDCSPSPQTIRVRMTKEAVLLKPGEHFDGTFLLDTKLFGGLKPGVYRVEAALSGWTEEKFTDAERSELRKIAGRFMAGEVSDSIRVTLTPSPK